MYFVFHSKKEMTFQVLTSTLLKTRDSDKKTTIV